MSSRHSRVATVGEYTALHISSAGTLVPVGLCVSTTSSTTITAGSGVVVTPTSMATITPGMTLNFANGTGNAEDVTVLSITGTTFTANFVNNHSGGYTIISRRGIDLGHIVINKIGSGCALTLYNGHPSMLSDAGSTLAVVDFTATPLDYSCTLDKGLFYTLTMGSSSCDLTLMYMDHAI